MIDFQHSAIANCLETTNQSLFFVKDVIGSGCEFSDESNAHVTIKNHSSKIASFLKIDKCIFDDSDGKKCDFSVSSDSTIYFVEIKGLEKFDDHLKRSKKRREARTQLANTINEFKKSFGLIDLKNTNAVVALIPNPINNYRKVVLPGAQVVIDQFDSDCGCSNIYEGNLIEL